MSAQALIVAGVVLWCTMYAAWTLLPAAAKRAIATRLLRLGVGWPLSGALQRALRPAGACGGCDSCGDAPQRPAGAEQPITLHRRTPH
jgi:hypothetical protein